MLKITGYADRVGVLPGNTIKFMVNCETAEYEAQVVRVVHGDTNPTGPGVKLFPVDAPINGTHSGRRQVIHAGSFGIVADLPAFAFSPGLTVSAVIQPTTPDMGEQGIVTKWDDAANTGFALFVNKAGQLACRIGAGGLSAEVSTDRPLRKSLWYSVSASFDAASREVTLRQVPLGDFSDPADFAEIVQPTEVKAVGNPGTPLIFGAFFSSVERDRPICRAHYNGKIEAPRLCAAPLDAGGVELLRAGPLPGPFGGVLIGAWDFSRDIKGTELTDVSSNGLHGTIVNMPTRGVVGHKHVIDSHDWKQAPEQWGAIHFHDDDVYDAGWEVDLEWTVPAGMKSGIYAVQLKTADQVQFIVFVVRPSKDGPRAKLLYLFPLATYLAYANEHFGTNSALVELHLNRATVLHPHQIFLNEHREYGHSMYDLHSDGSGVYYSSRLRPVLNMQPFIEANHGARPSNLWQFNADTHITDWLHESGIDYDVETDEDLHLEGFELLRPYKAVMTSTHPEYYSKTMWTSVQRFVQTGGRLIYMGGNGFYWRVAFHETEPGIMEVRRAEGGSRAWEPPTGEYYHSFTGEYGGMWRRQGPMAPNVLCGIGFIAQGFDKSVPYLRKPDSFDPRASFIFEGIGADEKIGDFGLIGGGASGMEVDSYNPDIGSPPHALVLASSATHTEAHVLVVEEMLFNFMGTSGNVCSQVRSDMVFFETPGGGAVFSVGSIAWSGALSHNNYDNNVSRIVKNVVVRFTDDRPFNVPAGWRTKKGDRDNFAAIANA